MGRNRQMKGQRKSTWSKPRLVVTVEGLKRDPQRLYFVQGTSVYSAPRRDLPGEKRFEMDIPNFNRRPDRLYYLKGNQVWEAPFARR